MTEIADLERGYRLWLRWYPKSFRREHEAEVLGVLMADARAGQRRPEPMECLDLMASGLRVRLRPRVPRSDRSAFAVARLMYLGAVVEFAVVLTVLATLGVVKASIVVSDPGYARAQWSAELTGALEPLVVAAGLAVGFWLWMAWATGHGHRWARALFGLFFCVNTYSLLQGLLGGSALYARADLAAGTILWLVELAAVTFIVRSEPGRIATSRSAAKGRAQGTTSQMITAPVGAHMEEEP